MKRNHRYHNQLLRLAFITFPCEDRRKITRAMWKARCFLREQYPFPEYLIGCKCESGGNGKMSPSVDFINFDDFLYRYLNLVSPFFATNSHEDTGT